MSEPGADIEPHRRVNALLLEHYQKQTEITRSYTTMVTGAGYAGLLTLWAGTRSHLGPSTVLATGFLIGLSLIIFVAFEIWKIGAGQRAEIKLMQGIAEFYSSPDFQLEMQNRNAVAIAATANINRAQPAIFMITMLTSFGAAIWLAVAMAAGAIRLWQTC